MDENDAAERKELNKLSESRRRAAWTMPGTNDRRRSSSKREPDKLPEHGGARRRRTRMEDYEAGSSMAVPVKVLEQQALKAAPETVLRKEIKSIEGRRRRAAAETAQEAKSSKKVWAALESQINAATSSATNKAAKKAAEAGRKALADLQKATGQPLITEEKAKAPSENEEAYEKDQEAKLIGTKQKFEDKALEEKIATTSDPMKKKQLQKARKDGFKAAEKKIAHVRSESEDHRPTKIERRHEEEVSVEQVKQEVSRTKEYRTAEALQKASQEDANELYAVPDGADDPPEKPIPNMKPSSDLETAKARVDDVKAKISIQQRRLKKAQAEADKINADKNQVKKEQADVDSKETNPDWRNKMLPDLDEY